jgi:hypothetical protein
MNIQTKAKCGECAKVYNLLDEDEANEWFYGHDCEGQTNAFRIPKGDK